MLISSIAVPPSLLAAWGFGAAPAHPRHAKSDSLLSDAGKTSLPLGAPLRGGRAPSLASLVSNGCFLTSCVIRISNTKADYYADPILSFTFWSDRKKKSHWCKIDVFQYFYKKSKQAFLCEDGARVIRFFARVIQQLGFWTRKIQANVEYYHFRRRAQCTSLGPGLQRPSPPSDSSLAAKRRARHRAGCAAFLVL